ncbi:MAG: hypothetical protein NXI32_30365, partial [bacterium]|nr:hypothetical protein [bacterium]
STLSTGSAGDLARSIPRQSAGGRTGPAADASMPVYGFNQTAAKPSTETRLLSPRLETRRRSSEGRSPALAAELGAPQATRWLESPSVSRGKSGQSPVDLAVDALSGSAAVQDVAELSGAARAIQRSQAGFGLPDASVASVPSPVESKALDAESARESQLAESTPAALGSDMVDISRSGVAGTSAADLPNEFAAGPLDSERLGPSLNMDSPSQIANKTLNSGRGDAYASRSRMRLQISPPGEGSVEMPTDESPGLASSDTGASGLASGDRGLTTRRNSERRETAGLHPLAIEAPPGPGGISVSDTISGSLLPRRRERAFEDLAPDLEVQRFARQEVGGPLAAGQVAMPQPAFQQRRERLRDRNPLDASSAEPQTELAIERGLAFLAKHQRQDGSWRLQDFDTQVLMTSDTAATGLALLAFQGAGYTHKEFKYAEVCEKAIQFLRERQLANGDLYIRQNPASDQNAWLYSHAIAAIAMCEAYGMTQDPELRQPAQRSIDFIVASQDPLRGGWRYRPGSGSDTSVSGWFMMALKSAQLAGLAVPPETFERLSSFLDLSQATDGRDYLYRYNPYAADTPQQRHGLQPTAVMTSVGLLMRLYMGWQRDRAEMIQGADYLLGQLPEHGTEQNSRRDTYYWYYATQVMFHMGGETWRRWHDRLYPLLIEHQVTEGENEGSWEPFAPTPDLWARYGGRLYVTTMNLLSLEVTYRHLPLYEATAPQAE